MPGGYGTLKVQVARVLPSSHSAWPDNTQNCTVAYDQNITLSLPTLICLYVINPQH